MAVARRTARRASRVSEVVTLKMMPTKAVIRPMLKSTTKRVLPERAVSHAS